MYYSCQGYKHVLQLSGLQACTTVVRATTMYYSCQGYKHVLQLSGLQACTTVVRATSMYYSCQGYKHVLQLSGLQPCTTVVRATSMYYNCEGYKHVLSQLEFCVPVGTCLLVQFSVKRYLRTEIYHSPARQSLRCVEVDICHSKFDHNQSFKFNYRNNELMIKNCQLKKKVNEQH